jgi:hypothetical protein
VGAARPGDALLRPGSPGNTVAALAAYWADATEDLLALEAANPGVAYRVRYEDVAADPDGSLAPVRASLRLGGSPRAGVPAGPPDADAGVLLRPGVRIPVEIIPPELRARVARLHAELGYPAPDP